MCDYVTMRVIVGLCLFEGVSSYAYHCVFFYVYYSEYHYECISVCVIFMTYFSQFFFHFSSPEVPFSWPVGTLVRALILFMIRPELSTFLRC